jgi:ferric-dicitrate binding protein FerR (iron transport regulator)
MSDTCARWIALSDREALGEALSAEESAFARGHAGTCAACRAEAEVWSEMAALVDGPPQAMPKQESDEELVAAAPLRRSRRPFVIAAGALACAAAALLFARERASGRKVGIAPPVVTVVAPREATVVLALTSGGPIEIDGRAGAVGQPLARGNVLFAREGSACLVIEPAVRACVERGSLVRVTDTGAHRRLELLGGKLAAELDPQPAGTSFGVTTRDGSAVALGTAFSVEVPPGDAPVVTHVLHGTVVVRSTAGTEQRVGAHEMTSMRDAQPTALPGTEEERDRSLVDTTTPARLEQAVPVRIESDAPGATVSVDERRIGTTPIALLLGPGDHVVTLTAPARASVRDTLHVGPGGPVVRRFELPLAPTAPKAVPAPVLGDSPASLLVAARERRARGDLDGAAAAYRELIERHGASAEAHAALVAFGELQLGRLSDPRGALESFDRYLARGGSLEEEASFGRIRALRALGRTALERSAIDTFLRRFPDGPLASALRERLRSIEGR